MYVTEQINVIVVVVLYWSLRESSERSKDNLFVLLLQRFYAIRDFTLKSAFINLRF